MFYCCVFETLKKILIVEFIIIKETNKISRYISYSVASNRRKYRDEIRKRINYRRSIVKSNNRYFIAVFSQEKILKIIKKEIKFPIIGNYSFEYNHDVGMLECFERTSIISLDISFDNKSRFSTRYLEI